VRHLIGHKRDVRAVTYFPNGRHVSGGADRSVRVWNPISGESELTVKASAPVYAVAVAPDGSSLAFAGRSPPRSEVNFVFLCDPGTGKLAGKYELRTERDVLEIPTLNWQPTLVRRPVPLSIWSVSFHAGGRYIAAAYRQPGGGNIPNGAGGHWWQLSGAAAHAPVPNDRIFALRFAPNGTALGVTTENKACVYRTHDATEPAVSVPLPSAWAETVAFLPGSEVMVVGANSFLFFIDVTGAGKPRKVKTRFRSVTGLAASPDGRTVLAGGKPGAVEVYDAETGSLRTAYDFDLGGVYDIAAAPDGLTFAVAGDRGLVVCDADW
jgi:WD40 repeat protein